jgi:peptidyl-prolyl cis-trans isomerase SurA
MSRPLFAIALLLAGQAFAGEAASPQGPPPGVLLDRVVAIVNDGMIAQSELDEAIATATSRLRENNTALPPADVLRRQVLDRLVIDEIQWQRAERAGIKISDEEVNDQLRRIAEANNLTLAQLPEVLARDGINYTSFREGMRKDIARQQLRASEVLRQVNITPRELDQFMERIRKLPDERTEYNFSHILIALPSDADPEQTRTLAARAEEIAKRAATEDFAQLAATYSSSQTALEGGAMGWRRGTELPTLLVETIVKLKPGEVGGPIEASNGFHIVKLNEVRSEQGDPVQEQTHARHILLNPNALQDDATIRQRLSDIRRRVLAGEDFAALAATTSEDAESAVNGGDLDWRGPGELVPEFEEQMAKLKDGEISEPFQSRYGWHIVQVLGRRKFDTTEDMLRQRAFTQLRTSKADLDLEIWLRRLRDESFIDTELD